MTNQAVGKVYDRVIQDVIHTSQADVQDSGVDTAVLEELKKVWQEKLSSFKVATFPWDPAEVVEPVPPKTEEQPENHGEISVDGVRIKPDPEADLPPPPPPAPLGQPLSDPSLAAARAQQMVEKKLGAATQQRPMGLMLPSLPQPHLGGQTDGPDDGPDVSRFDADQHIRQVVLEGEEIRSYEDAIGEAMRRFDIQSDVMQARPLNKKKRKAAAGLPKDEVSSSLVPALAGASITPKALQTDGPEMDEDAINSDLDDPDEEAVDDDDDGEGIPQIMLCMYDKVQRTKNKWKCVLRDGVLTVNGREYVFRKANGEYEW
ncbi:hypothetical protein H072_4411 [Dactylellina haptotyla CBS 200.50]|uniref:Uncharacterized protein n=1 Tax=Dactylellina haptotyla (strain CBS 200.50) TaxID=1284197 RepID=S8AFN3_DACHA|nr:hypothetical protein H072_4411 [Dactylellina haptotyla CBS 200.50]